MGPLAHTALRVLLVERTQLLRRVGVQPLAIARSGRVGLRDLVQQACMEQPHEVEPRAEFLAAPPLGARRLYALEPFAFGLDRLFRFREQAARGP